MWDTVLGSHWSARHCPGHSPAASARGKYLHWWLDPPGPRSTGEPFWHWLPPRNKKVFSPEWGLNLFKGLSLAAMDWGRGWDDPISRGSPGGSLGSHKTPASTGKSPVEAQLLQRPFHLIFLLPAFAPHSPTFTHSFSLQSASDAAQSSGLNFF